MDLNLFGKTALVCGSTQGIGFAVAKELALLGANIVLLARDEQQLNKVKAELSKQGEQNHYYIKNLQI